MTFFFLTTSAPRHGARRMLAATLLTSLSLGFAGPAAASPLLDRWIYMADLNSDGAISRDEVRAFRDRRFGVWDRNQNGVLDQGDAGAAVLMGGAQVERFLAVADANGDGVVSRRELIEGPTPGFDLADADGDGLLTRAEAQTLLDSMLASRGL